MLAGTEVDEEREIQYPDGETRHVHLNYIPDRSDDQVLGYFFLVQDVTERNRAQEALRAINADLDRRIGDATAELAYRNQELSKENRAREESEERVDTRAERLCREGVLAKNYDFGMGKPRY